MTQQISRLSGSTLYDNRQVLLKVYPELKYLVDSVHIDIKEAGCQGCARNKYTVKLLHAITKIKYDGRDLTPLAPVIGLGGISRLSGNVQATPQLKDIPREDCPHCLEKHLASVGILLSEYMNGYKQHLPYAIAHYEEARREGLTDILNFEETQIPKTLAHIWKILGADKDKRRLLGLTNILGELTPHRPLKDAARKLRMTFHETPLPDDNPAIVGEGMGIPSKIVLSQKLSPGDVVMMTAVVRDLSKKYGKKLQIGMDTSCREIWQNNPRVNQKLLTDPTAKKYTINYTDAVRSCNQLPYHFIHGYRLCVEKKLDIALPPTGTTGEIFMSAQEKEWDTVRKFVGDPKPYWLIMAGCKSDFTTKLWPRSYWQEVIDELRDEITFVQVGKSTSTKSKGLHHKQHKLKGTISLVNKTSLRELIQLTYHSAGAICGITSLMHLASAVPTAPGFGYTKRPCVVLAGGREPAHWEMYQHHAFLHNCGMYKCNRQGGCWKARTEKLNDGNKKKDKSLCLDPVKVKSRQFPRCMAEVTPDMVIKSVRTYLASMENPYG